MPVRRRQRSLLFTKLRHACVIDVDITELKLMILAVLERHGMGPEWRRSMRGAQLGGMLDLCGGARQVLAEALAAVRSRRVAAPNKRTG
jgi:hypothetical protein